MGAQLLCSVSRSRGKVYQNRGSLRTCLQAAPLLYSQVRSCIKATCARGLHKFKGECGGPAQRLQPSLRRNEAWACMCNPERPGSFLLLVPIPDTAAPAHTLSSAIYVHSLIRQELLLVCMIRGGLHDI